MAMKKHAKPISRAIPTGMKKKTRIHASLSSCDTKQLNEAVKFYGGKEDMY